MLKNVKITFTKQYFGQLQIGKNQSKGKGLLAMQEAL